ncbi:MAG: MBOAT family O-acyltransferase [Acidimicrobiia bacterium]
MLFPTITFAIFVMVVLPISWLLLPGSQRWKIFMLAASYYFYGYWNWRFVGLLVLSTLVNQGLTKWLHRTEQEAARKGIVMLAVAANISLLAYFKYRGFFVDSASDLLNDIGLDVSPQIVSLTLPVGISFFTFQALSYVLDVYRRSFDPVRTIDFAVYLSFFPHVVAGPIVRAAEFIPQLWQRHDPRKIDASRAFFLIFGGLFKKVVLANFLGVEIVDNVFGTPKQFSALEILVGIYAYAVQIYCDFSGYTDIAIGIALLLGFRFPQNFDAPYTSVSIQDFWRRWHMTLSRWLRDYLYIPLGGNRGTSVATYRNLMLTMVLGGLWHGAAWTFVAWGAIHGGALCVEHARREHRIRNNLPEPKDTRGRRFWQRFVTFQIVCLGWVFFRSDSFDTAWTILTRLVTAWSLDNSAIKLSILLALAVGIGTQYLPAPAIGRFMAQFSRLTPVMQGLALGFVLLFIDVLGPQGVAPFIYFQF